MGQFFVGLHDLPREFQFRGTPYPNAIYRLAGRGKVSFFVG